jgi:hypothetical protein
MRKISSTILKIFVPLAALLLAMLVVFIATRGEEAGAGPEVISRISLSNVSGGGNSTSHDPWVTPDGRFSDFGSDSFNLLGPGGDSNGVTDIFRKELQTGTIIRVSTTSSGGQADGASQTASTSDDGRYVAFTSRASNLVAPGGDTNGFQDIYVKDLQTGSVSLASTDSAESVLGNGDSDQPTISADGRYVAFRSLAANLVAGDTNGVMDVFVRDTVDGTTTRVSTSSTGGQANALSGLTYGPWLSAGGRYVAFESDADNLIGAGADTNATRDIFVKDTQTGVTTRVSTDAAGGQANGPSQFPAISADGRYVVFRSTASNLAPGDTLMCGPENCSDVFRKDTISGAVYWISTTSSGAAANANSWDPHLSADGRYAAFSTDASNLAAGDGNGNLDIFVKDALTGEVVLASRSADGLVGNDWSIGPFVNTGGAYVAFESMASNLTAADTNGAIDAFLAATSFAASDYWFTWYDSRGGMNWVLVASPSTATADLWFDLDIAGVFRALPRWCGASCSALQNSIYVGGQTPPGKIIASQYAGVMGGPVRIGSLTGGAGVVSQRTLWPAGGDSLEEVPAVRQADLSSHYLWTWYDMQGPGFSNWVLVANPGSSNVFYRIRIAGVDKASGIIAPGLYVIPTFPGEKGGPVEVQAWSDGVGGLVPADVIASQRVLSADGRAFNEVSGLDVSLLTDRYVWTWYDMQSSGAQNWVLVANPGAASLFYEIEIGLDGCAASPPPGTACQQDGGTPLAPNQVITPTFDGIINGPVRVQGYANAAHTLPANILASQRSIWGPSFEEVPGYPANLLTSEYHWTIYDQASPGVTNWVLVANPSVTNSIYYEITVGGSDPGPGGSGTIPPGGFATPTFLGLINGPVMVRAWTDSGKATPANVMASQRVLWKGHFNETLGTVLP